MKPTVTQPDSRSLRHALLAVLLMSQVTFAVAIEQTAKPVAMATAKSALPQTADLGRLFMAPDRRNALERQRQTNRLEALASEGDTLTVSGLVRRSSGRDTVWVNQRPQDNQGNPAAGLRVGETENRGTQERSDLVPPGAIQVKRGQAR